VGIYAFSSEVRDRILSEFIAGGAAADLARKFNTTRQVIYGVVKRAGLNARTNQKYGAPRPDIENLQLRHGRHGKGKVMRCCDCGSTNIISDTLASNTSD
jgi:hypothetical protein